MIAGGCSPGGVDDVVGDDTVIASGGNIIF